MPELPEVEVVRRYLDEHLPGSRIESVDVKLPRLLKNASPEAFKTALKGQVFAAVRRKGKYLVLGLDGPKSLLVHLRMTGRLVWKADPGARLPPYTRIVFQLSKGVLAYGDVRTLGELWLIPSQGLSGVPGFDALGPDALDPKLTAEGFARALRAGRSSVKAFLLNQRNLAGVGNIYADEALFLAGIRPERPCAAVSAQEAESLFKTVRQVFETSIESGGTTFRDFLDGSGREGGNAANLYVYGREGKPCRVCGTAIELTHIAGRGTRFCPKCQS